MVRHSYPVTVELSIVDNSPDVDRLAVVANARADGESKVAALGVRLLRLVQVVAHSGSILDFNKCYYKSLLLIFF